MKGSFEVVKEDGYAKIKYRNEPELLIQVILGIATIFFWILSLFIRELFMVVEIILGLFMFSFAYNNYKNFNKKGMAIICLVIGLLFILTAVLL